MRMVGFSTGALAYGEFEKALQLLSGTTANAVELSALRQNELDPLVHALSGLALGQFGHVSVHLPSSIVPEFENTLLEAVPHLPNEWLLVTHPDVIRTWERWESLGERLCIENMDKRKPIGQTASDLRQIFARLPRASFCLDIGHAHQVDPTMGEAVLIIEEFRGRLRQLHVSEVNSQSKHDPISLESASAFSLVSHLIPHDVPAILESRLPSFSVAAVEAEIESARRILDGVGALELAGD